MIETSSDLLWSSSAIFDNLWEMFGKCSEPFIWPSEQFWKIFGNLQKVVRHLWKIVKNVVITMFI